MRKRKGERKKRKGEPWKGDSINHQSSIIHHHHSYKVEKCDGHQRVFFSTAFIFWSFSSFLFVHSATFYLSRLQLKTVVDRLPAVEPLML